MAPGGVPVEQAAVPLEEALGRVGAGAENWDTRAALLWSLITAERFDPVEAALEPMLTDVRRTGSTRGLVAAYSTLGLLKLRLGALPEADAAARVALRILQDGDFTPGLPFAVTVLTDVAIEAGELDQAEALLNLLPRDGWQPGVGTVLIPAARGRLRLAQGRAAEALGDFQTCASMFSSEVWGTEIRDVGYLHARAGAVQALLLLGQRQRAQNEAEAHLAELEVFGTPRALGIALRSAGLAQGGSRGLELLGQSVTLLRGSPALLERAHSLTELGAALRRAGRRAAARDVARRSPRPGSRLRRPGAHLPRPRGTQVDRGPTAPGVAHRVGGVDPERTADRATGSGGTLQPRDRARPLCNPQDGRSTPDTGLRQARHRATRGASGDPRPRKK